MANVSDAIHQGTIRTARALSENGTVVAYPGQATDPSTVIAYRKVWTRHEALSLSDALGLSPGDPVRPCLTIKDGDFVSIGDTIAQREGRKTRTVLAKKSGRFLGLSANKLIFEFVPRDRERCIAGFPGIVTEILPYRGARLETEGTLVRGVWGNGKFGQGILMSVDFNREEGTLTNESITLDFAGAVVFANTCHDAKALQRAVKVSMGGLILGSLPADLLSIAESLPIPVILTDRIGSGRMATPAQLALGKNIIKFAYLTGLSSRYGNPRKPEIVIPKDEYTPQKSSAAEPLEIGDTVRIIDGFYGGEIGVISDLVNPDAKNAEFEQVRVRLDQDTELALPIHNVERVRLDDSEQ